MAKANWQKVKLLKMMDLLRSESSPEHPLTTDKISTTLINQGINCDKKTLTNDIGTLRNFGYDVGVKQIGHEKGYFVPEKEKNFSQPEIKIIIDALQAANFITREKTDELIQKVAGLDMEQREDILATSVVCFNKRKHSNEEIYDNVGTLKNALAQKKKASFVYFDKNENGDRVYRKDRQRYIVEPMALIFNEDNYYLMCFSSKYDGITNYRVDRMDEVLIEDEPVSEKAILPDDDIAEYTEQVFKENDCFSDCSTNDYLRILTDLYAYLKDQDSDRSYWYAVGSNQQVQNSDNGAFVSKAKKAHKKLDGKTADSEGINDTLRELLGNDFPKVEGKTDERASYESSSVRKAYDRGASTEKFIEELAQVDIRYSLHIDCNVTQDGWRPFLLRAFLRTPGGFLRHNKHLDFYITGTNCPAPYQIWWKVRNVGEEARRRNMIRGEINKTDNSHHGENTNFYGPHYVECYLIKNGVCVARDKIEVPIGTE